MVHRIFIFYFILRLCVTFQSGEFVAQFKFTVLLMPTGQHKITGLPFENNLYDTKYKIDDPELKVIYFILFYLIFTLKWMGYCH